MNLIARRRFGPFANLDFHGEGHWLAVLAVLTFIESAWWMLCWRAGIAPAPRVGTYLGLAIVGVLGALVLRLAFQPDTERPGLAALIVGTALIGLGASLFLPLKYAIPGEVPFWFDLPLAHFERQPFGVDPWRIADDVFGWALVPMDRVYALWLPVQSLVLFSVMLLPPSPAKSRAMISYGLAWFLLGVVAAALCASVGPVFYDRLLSGDEFAALDHRLSAGGLMVRVEADAMWTSFATGRPSLVAGISAMPSLHVAISFWIWLTARSLAPRAAPLALAYAVFMWVASVELGWHYVSDGLAGSAGMLGVWSLAKLCVRCAPVAPRR